MSSTRLQVVASPPRRSRKSHRSRKPITAVCANTSRSSRRETSIGVALAFLVTLKPGNGDASTTTPTTSRITRVVVDCPRGTTPETAARSFAALGGSTFVVDAEASSETATVRDASTGFVVEFANANQTSTSNGIEFVGLVIGSDNPARAKNASVRSGATSASNGERCAGDAYAGCQVTSSGFSARFARTGRGWTEGSIVRVVLRGNDPGDVAERILRSLGPDGAVVPRGAFPSLGVVERAAEDMSPTRADSSAFVGYPRTKASTMIEIQDRRSGDMPSSFTVRAFRLDLPEGCGVVRL
jgi:hypothetical protein